MREIARKKTMVQINVLDGFNLGVDILLTGVQVKAGA
jgi:hypothetical protein